MKKKLNNAADNSRRNFLRNAALAATGFYIVPRHVLGKGFIAPSDKLNVAGVGIGGKGESDLWNFYQSGKANIVGLCDVDDRMAKTSRSRYPKAAYFHDYREMFDKMGKSIDAVSVSTPDHMHAVIAMAAMQMGKHVYVQKPMAHDIYEARVMTKAAHQYKVVTQMGNQGASGDGVRQLREWYNAGVIGEVDTVYCFTDRPVWPQGIAWPNPDPNIPAGLDWKLWQGNTALRDYVDGLLPFNWRGWWEYGTGALGDMGCHLMEAPFRVLGLGYPTAAECSVATQYTKPWTRAFHPESGPIASHITLTFNVNGRTVKMHWMDGGIQPDRPEELGSNELFGDGGNAILFVGSKGKMMASTYAENPRLLPLSRNQEVHVPQTLARVPGSANGHYAAWVEACIAGYGSKEQKELSSNFDLAGPLTEIVLMGNLAIRSYNVQEPNPKNPKSFNYPGRNIQLQWDGANMRITNFEPANAFVKRTYQNGYSL